MTALNSIKYTFSSNNFNHTFLNNITTKFTTRIALVQFQKRTMLGRAISTAMHEGTPVLNQQVRTFATFSFAQRKMSKKGPYPAEVVDKEDELVVMPDNDFSGKPHILMISTDMRSATGEYYVHGSFSTSPSPYNGIKPLFVDHESITGLSTHQYFHLYPEIKKISEHAVKLLDHDTVMILGSDPYRKLRNKITIEHNLDIHDWWPR